ncbi:ABC transporter permease [Halobacteriales archaeon QS_1_68_20]|nr:MAG: ABC transporter permease [Halobacteriales archaeon QS_1_68_20]
MSRYARVRAASGAAWRAFVRRRVAVFFTFFFPAILVVIFGALVRTGAGGTGLFVREADYYVAGYLAVVVLQTPLSRVSSEVARHREGNRFEKLATTPLTRAEWLLAQTLVNVVLVGVAAVIILALVTASTGASPALSPALALAVAAGTALFCGFGALLGRLADSQDGAITAANAVGLPLLFLSETFVPPVMLPAWFRPLLSLSPLTYFSRAARTATAGEGAGIALAVLVALSVGFFLAGALAIPRTD